MLQDAKVKVVNTRSRAIPGKFGLALYNFIEGLLKIF
jgi:hypothetical protein